MLEAWACLLHEMVALLTEGENGQFRIALAQATPTRKWAWHQISRESTYTKFEACSSSDMRKVKIFAFARNGPFSQIIILYHM